MRLTSLAKAARLPFILLTPICILLAYAAASQITPSPNMSDALFILLGAVAAHLAVNLLNEYQDFKSGLDLTTVKTPFSGGSGALPDDPDSAGLVLSGALVCLGIVCWVGLHFLFAHNASLIVLLMGLAGLVLIVVYTKQVNRLPWLCLLAPGFGFGSLMVLCSVLILSGQITPLAFGLSMVPFFQVNHLLLLNQIPDIEADRKVGRNHLAIAYGVSTATKAYGILMLLPFVTITALWLDGLLPTTSLLTGLLLIPGVKIYQALARYGADIAQQPQFLGLNVAITLLTPTILALSLVLA